MLLLALMGAVAVASVGIGWFEDPPSVTAREAATVVADALVGAGVSASVDPAPLASTYQPVGGQRVEVWQTFATVEGGTILISVAHDGAAPLFLDDRSPNGSAQLLSEAQFEAVVAGIEDPGRRRLLQRNISLTVAAALVLTVAVALGARPRPLETP